MSLKSLIKVADYYNMKYGFGKVAEDETDLPLNNFLVIIKEGVYFDGTVLKRYDIQASNWKDAISQVKEKEGFEDKHSKVEYKDIYRRDIILFDRDLTITILDRDYMDRDYKWKKKHYSAPCGNGQCDGTCRICEGASL